MKSIQNILHTITKGLLTLFISISALATGFSQELNCNIQINYQQVTSVNQDVFDKMKTAIYEFVNNQRWTNDRFKEEEKISCQLFFNIDEAITTSMFKATVSVQASRPVYGTNLETTTLNFIDKNVVFEYQEDQPLYFVQNAYSSNLSSLLAYYSYLILGFDYDTFEKNGGGKYYDKANEIVSYAQQAPDQFQNGWTIDSKNGRYELIQDLTNSQFGSFRNYLYIYHRQGLDVFEENPAEFRSKILKIMEDHKRIFQVKQGSMLLRIFFQSKQQELINIFSKGSSVEKDKFLKIVQDLDPGNITRYQQINKN